MSYKALRKTLLQELNISEQALYQRANKIRNQLPMTPKEAICVISHHQRIPINRYLDSETVEKVRILVQQLGTLTQPVPAKATPQKQAEEPKSPRNAIAIPREFENFAAILSTRKIQEAVAMAPTYILLYALENSIREVIDQTMTSKHGRDWWDSFATSSLLRKVEGHMSDDQKDRWHQRRGSRPIDYLDMKDLKSLMRAIQEEFIPDIIPDLEWFIHLIDEVYKSRCVVCHMNPLSQVNISAVKLRCIHWQQQVRDSSSKS